MHAGVTHPSTAAWTNWTWPPDLWPVWAQVSAPWHTLPTLPLCTCDPPAQPHRPREVMTCHDTGRQHECLKLFIQRAYWTAPSLAFPHPMPHRGPPPPRSPSRRHGRPPGRCRRRQCNVANAWRSLDRPLSEPHEPTGPPLPPVWARESAQTGARRSRCMVLHLQTFVEIVTQDTLNVVHACVPSSGTHTQTHTHTRTSPTNTTTTATTTMNHAEVLNDTDTKPGEVSLYLSEFTGT